MLMRDDPLIFLRFSPFAELQRATYIEFLTEEQGDRVREGMVRTGRRLAAQSDLLNISGVRPV
jgi:hypothetical protein